MPYDHNGEWTLANTINIPTTKIGLIKALRHMYPGLNLRDAKEIAEMAMERANKLTKVYTPEFVDKRNEVAFWALTERDEWTTRQVLKADNWFQLEVEARDAGFPDPIIHTSTRSGR
jgi:hypothetical protein